MITEKPLCILKDELAALKRIDEISKIRFFNHAASLASVLEKIISIAGKRDSKSISKITFTSPRDRSYLDSWKTSKEHSGGILFNLGIHYFDLLIQAFGTPIKTEIKFVEQLRASGKTFFNSLEVEWFFSIDPSDQLTDGSPTRIFTMNGEQLNFSQVAEDLHLKIIKAFYLAKIISVLRI